MTPTELKAYLNQIINKRLQISTMIWGSPGIGKSSIVAQVAQEHDIDFVDVRISQLAPTDLRGLPVAEDGISKWYPPEFLPRDGIGILFLDEINMAPPAMQGVAQQLILDRRVGSYTVPEGWYIWAAGNRKEDRASVFDMPAPLANRFIHLEVVPEFDSFKAYALEKKVHEQVIAFLSFRPTLLHHIHPQQPAWPSPRSWEYASTLHDAGLDGDNIPFPREPSQSYATTIWLTVRAEDANQAYNAFTWLSSVATAEWLQLCVLDLVNSMERKEQKGKLATLIKKDPKLQEVLKDCRQLLGW